MSKTENILMTGATGFLGSHILKILLEKTKSRIFLVIRAPSEQAAQERCLGIIDELFNTKVSREYLSRVEAIAGEITKKQLGLNKEIYKRLIREINVIYHVAAITGFRIHLNIARKVNVLGTKNVLALAEDINNLERFHHISSVFIAGAQKGKFNEETDIGRIKEFNNTYEQSKHEAELIIRQHLKKGLNIYIFRPSIIVGEYLTGKTTNYKMFYEPLRFLSKELFDAIPANPRTAHNIIPVDVAAEAIFLLSTNESKGGVYHIISPNNNYFGVFFKQASEYFKCKNPKYVPIENFNIQNLTSVQKRILEPFIPYFNLKIKFQGDKTSKLLSKYNFKCPKIDKYYFLRLFKFCIKSGFIKRC